MEKILKTLASNKPIIKKRKSERESREFLIGDTRDTVQETIKKERNRYI